MAIECMVWALEQDGLKTNEKFVLLGIANHSRPDGKNAFPSLDTLARYTALSVSTVQRAINALCEKGVLVKDSGGGRKSNTYTLRMHRAEVIQLEIIEGGHSDHPKHDPVDPEGSHSDHAPRSALTMQPSQALTKQPSQALTKEPLSNRNTTAIEPRAKKRDEVWDAIMEACGVNTATINSNERGRYNKAVKLLKESGATGAQIHTRVQVYRRKFKGASVTPVAIANHWSELDPATVPVEDVTTAPKGWDAIKQVRDKRQQESDSPWA
jgi:biotin operon repressor